MPRRGGPFGPARLRVLIADPDSRRARRVGAALAAELINAEIETVATIPEAERRLSIVPCDAVIASADLGGLHVLDRLRPFCEGHLILSAGTTDLAADARLHGADDLVLASSSPDLLVRRLARMGSEMARAAGLDRATSEPLAAAR